MAAVAKNGSPVKLLTCQEQGEFIDFLKLLTLPIQASSIAAKGFLVTSREGFFLTKDEGQRHSLDI